MTFSGGAASLDSTISASSGSLSKNSGNSMWGDYAFSDYELIKDGCAVPPTAHTVSPQHTHSAVRALPSCLLVSWVSSA